MAATRKYEGLPDIDEAAPEFYETPDLVDDLSTAQDTSARSPSVDSDEDEGTPQNDEDGKSGIDRRHWEAGQARSHFKPSRIKADGVDFSDRLNLSRGSYKTYARRRRPGTYDDDDPEELGDLSDEEEESIDHKLARIRREVEQLKVSAEEKVSTATKGSHSKSRGEDENILDGIEKISDALEAVYNDRHGGPKSAETELSRTISMFSRPNQTAKEPAETSNELQPSSTHSQVSQILSKAADFDERLTALETSLGLSGRNMPDSASDIIKPILPSLKSLERSIQLATAQSGTLDLAQSKMRQLLKDAERLNRARSEEHSNANGDGEKSSQINTEQASKINALYGLLPTIDTMSPTLPLVLDRLRTLQLLHTNAADASATLDEMEKRQDDQEEEIKTWRQALEKVEENLKENETTLAENMEKMGSWVRELESKASKYT